MTSVRFPTAGTSSRDHSFDLRTTHAVHHGAVGHAFAPISGAKIRSKEYARIKPDSANRVNSVPHRTMPRTASWGASVGDLVRQNSIWNDGHFIEPPRFCFWPVRPRWRRSNLAGCRGHSADGAGQTSQGLTCQANSQRLRTPYRATYHHTALVSLCSKHYISCFAGSVCVLAPGEESGICGASW